MQMNADKLSKRLECVASYIKKGMRIADIGSDHAYLPCYSVKHGLATYAIAGEIAEGPYNAANQQVKSEGLSDSIEVRKGDGLAVIEVGDVDCVVIAGMGGALITNILEQGKGKLAEVERLILQPNIGTDNIRRWLLENDWELVDEQLIEEGGKIYEILVADKGIPLRPYKELQTELLMGPFLLKEKSEVFQKKWIHDLKQLESILEQVNQAESTTETEEKRKSLINKIKNVKEALK